MGVLTAFRVEERGRFLEETEEAGGGRLVGGVKVVGGSSCFLSSSQKSEVGGNRRIGDCICTLLIDRLDRDPRPRFLTGCPAMAERETEEGGMGSEVRKWLTGRPVRLKPKDQISWEI